MVVYIVVNQVKEHPVRHHHQQILPIRILIIVENEDAVTQHVQNHVDGQAQLNILLIKQLLLQMVSNYHYHHH